MKPSSRFAAAVIFAILLSPLARGDKAPAAAPEVIRKQAQECADALMKADYAAFVDLIHPKVLELAGGRDKMVQMIKNAMLQMKSQKISITQYQIGAPGEVTSAGPDLLCIVPTSVELKTATEKIKQKTYLLAVSSDNGKRWTFIDGADLDAEKLKSVLPNAPKDFKLPAREAAVIEKI